MFALSIKLLLLLICSFMFQNVHSLAVMSVDLGSEWMKVAIVSPGVPMEIALNRESQRKTPVTVAFRDGERTFGDPALSIGVRFPDKSYSYMLDILGKSVDNPLVELFKKRFPYYSLGTSDRGTVVFKHSEGSTFSTEELLSMLLKQAQEIAQNAAGQPIKDAVITVPPFFSQAERRALLQAAEMTGINILQLINSNTAVALNYGVFRRRDFNETSTNIMFYDMGAGSTVATIVSYQLVKSKETGDIDPQLTIKGVGFDRTLGGLEMQLRLRDHFAEAFNKAKKTKSNIFENNRAMAKLFKEAGRVKKVLSANTDHNAQVESLLDDIDFKCPISRADFELLCSDLFKRVTQPIEVALKSANLEMNNIDQVILAGSGARIPKVQQILLEFVKVPELGKSINTDESAALGAAYQAAHLSKGFKVKTFFIKDSNIYPIQVDFQREYELEDKTPAVKIVRRTLFTRNNILPQKKIMTFNRHVKDFDIYVNYGELNFLNDFELGSLGSLNISKVSLKGVDSALGKHSGDDTDYKGVKAHFRMDESGILHVEQVESVFEKAVEEEVPKSDLESTLAKLGSTIGRLFSGSDSKSSDTKDDKAGSKDAESSQKTKSEEAKTGSAKESKSGEKFEKADDESKQEEKTENNVTATKKEPKLVAVKEPLTADQFFLDLKDWSDSEAKQVIKKLRDLDEHDRVRLAKDKAKNSLESFIVETRDRLYREEYEHATTDEERDNIKNALSETGDWLEYESSDATTEVFYSKLSELKKLTRDLFERVKEHQDRPEAIKALNEILNLSSIFLNGAHNMSEEEQIFTEVELKTLGKLISDTKQWKQDIETEQATLALSVQPKLTVKLISEKIANLDREVKYLLNKARFASPLKKKKSAEKATTNNDTDQNTTTAEPENVTIADGVNDTGTIEQIEIPEVSDLNVEEVVVETDSTPITEAPSPDTVQEDNHTEL